MSNKTPLYDSHLALNAHMVEFSQTWLPVRYQSEAMEHKAVREAVGIFDISHMGEFYVSGPDAKIFLQKLLTNDVEQLSIDQAQYTLMLNENGGIIDDLIIYQLFTDKFFLCVNAANIEKDFRWLNEQASGFRVELDNASDHISLLALQGPKSFELLQSITEEELPAKFAFKQLYLNGIDCLVAHTGYTGEQGVEIFVKDHEVKALWELLLERGAHFGILPCGLSARDSLRLEAGLLLWGQDMDEKTTPLEAGLMFAVDLKKDFIGKKALLEQKERGASKKLRGFCLKDRAIARHGCPVLTKGGSPLGVVTSGSFLSEKKLSFGFAYVDPKTELGQEVLIDIRGRSYPAILQKPRFLLK